MKRAKGSRNAATRTNPQATPVRVSLRSIYSEALREVMADPRKAIVEHDPWLAALLFPRAPAYPAKD